MFLRLVLRAFGGLRLISEITFLSPPFSSVTTDHSPVRVQFSFVEIDSGTLDEKVVAGVGIQSLMIV